MTMDAGHDTTFRFQECLEVKNIDDAYAALKDLCAQTGVVKIDISPIAAIDTAGIQLLLALCEKTSPGLTVTPVGFSAAVANGLAKLGLRDSIMGRHVNA